MFVRLCSGLLWFVSGLLQAGVRFNRLLSSLLGHRPMMMLQMCNDRSVLQTLKGPSEPPTAKISCIPKGYDCSMSPTEA